jgi:hypothetical protein
MVATRNQANRANQANQANRSARRSAPTRAEPSDSYEKLQSSYKGLTPVQQSISRHNRFLERLWKTPRSERHAHRKCVACLGDFFDSDGDGTGYIGIMACDHAIHLNCLIRHADAYLDRLGVPSIDNGLSGMSATEFRFAAEERYITRRLGAPCPACRMEYPMRHMTVFDEGPVCKGLSIHVPHMPRA